MNHVQVQPLQRVYEVEVEVVPESRIEPIICSFRNLATREERTEEVDVFVLEQCGIHSVQQGDKLRCVIGHKGIRQYRRVSST